VLGQLVMTARGQRPAFQITGTDHPTRDGTGIRDYIHVWDLARAHVAAIDRFDAVLQTVGTPSVTMNVGTGAGVTVRELVAAFERVSGTRIPVEEAPPRPGDAVGAYAAVDLATRLLGWKTELTLDDAIASALAWGVKRKTVLGYE
jgi:UDP-glucose 4-epimerase